MIAHLEISRGAPTRTAFVVHGILGSAANWRSFVRRLVDTSDVASPVANVRWILVDLRGHGESEPGEPPHTVAACAADLRALASALGVSVEVVIGHSFGGKVALAFAANNPSVTSAWFLDTPPGPAAITTSEGTSNDEIANVFTVIESLPEPLPSRPEVAAAFRARGLSDMLAQWMTTNVRGDAERGYRWKFDLPTVRALVADYAALDLWPIVEAPRPGLSVHGVRGGRSNRFSADDILRLDALGAHVIPEAGHWLHVDAPVALAAYFEAAVS